MYLEMHGIWHQTWIQTPALLLTSCVTEDTLIALSLNFLIMKIGMIIDSSEK